MPRLTVTSFVSLDGVMQAPGGSREDRSGAFLHGGWVVPHVDEAFGRFISGVFGRAGAFLLGRGTYQIFAGWWPAVTDPADPVAAALNRLPKHVASRTLDRVEWANSALVRDVPGEVARLKGGQGTGELQVHGSPGLLQTLLEHELVDELNLLTFPVVLGAGKRLFGSGAVPSAWELAGSSTTGKGVVIATYRAAGRPVLGEVGPEAPRG
jgi:dihydrofolate reductase